MTPHRSHEGPAGAGLAEQLRGRPDLWSIRPSAWLAESSCLDVAIAWTLALAGFALAPLPVLDVAATLAAAALFAQVLDLMKRTVFCRRKLSLSFNPRSRRWSLLRWDATC